jgi:solute carrier family 25 phosphate transporter 3
MATFLVYEKSVQTVYGLIDRKELSSAGVTGINLGAGLVAGLAAAVVSQPADTILSKVNKDKGQPGEGTARRLVRIATELGPRAAFTGMRARLVMVGGMTAVQFGIYGDTKKVCLDLITLDLIIHHVPMSPLTESRSQLFGATDGVELK